MLLTDCRYVSIFKIIVDLYDVNIMLIVLNEEIKKNEKLGTFEYFANFPYTFESL